MRYLSIKYHYFSWLLSEVPKDKNTNKYIQLEPLYTNPNLLKYVRCLKPKLDNDKYLWDLSKWKDIFLLSLTKPEDQEQIADKFSVTAGWKEYVD